jgi:aspartate 1-decarboxylase
MFREVLKSKLHRLKVTAADINYQGSITIDEKLLSAAKIAPFEKVQVVDVTNGARLETYVLKGKPGGGEVVINGAAARLVHPGDLIIVLSYTFLNEEELEKHQPLAVFVNENNEITEVKKYNPDFDSC